MNDPQHHVGNTTSSISGNATVLQSGSVSIGVVNAGTSPEGTRGFGRFAPPRMVDRHGPLAEARTVIGNRDGAATLLFVLSDPGSGGSAFGLKALHETYVSAPERFPGGYHFADLSRGEPLGGVTEMLRSMGVAEDEIPASREARIAALRGRPEWSVPVAVLVDSPRTFSEVLPFTATSPDSLTVVVTTTGFDPRTLTPDENALFRGMSRKIIRLGDLEPEDAETLFLQYTDMEPRTDLERAMVADLVSAAGTRPSRLVAYADAVWQESFVDGDGLARAHAALLGAGTEAGEVSQATMVLRGLPQHLREVAHDVARLPDTDVGAEIVAAVSGRSPADLAEPLEALAERRVLRRVRGAGAWSGPRYVFRSPALHRALAQRAEKPVDDLTAALSHYAVTAHAAHRALAPQRWLQYDLDGESAFDEAIRTAGSFSGVQARAVLATEHRALTAVIARAVEAGRLLESAELCELLWPYWFNAGSFADVIDSNESVLNAALVTPHVSPARLCRLSVQCCVAYRRNRDLPRARALGDRAVALAVEVPPQVAASAHEADGDVSADEGDTDRARRCYGLALDTVRGVDDRAVHIVERKLASLMLGQEGVDLAEVADRLGHARSLLTEDDHQNHARIHTEFARLRAREGDVGAALAEFDRAVARHALLHDLRRMADNHVLRADHAPEGPRADLERALDLYREAGADGDAKRVQRRLDALA